MTHKHQTSLADHFPPTPAVETLRSGVVSQLGWTNHKPTLYFADDTEAVGLASLIGRSVELSLSDERVCTRCLTPSSYYICDSCRGDPPNANCVWNPGIECTYQNCPFPEFKRQSCSHDFVVYLAATDRVKVGIARESGRVARWKTQGASNAVVFATTPNRKIAGIIESCCSQVIPDRTADGWYRPLETPIEALHEAAVRCAPVVPHRLRSCIVGPLAVDAFVERIIELEYPRAADITDAELAERSSFDECCISRLLGIRGSMLVTGEYTFNMRTARGHTLTIASAY